MDNYSQIRQICEEYKGIKICKVPSGQNNENSQLFTSKKK